ncbi:hypothetical protein DVH05_005274 [Phytophthora capsici]|nr:hypothetical protein DVH05_005274 [Phytophthora capsici]
MEVAAVLSMLLNTVFFLFMGYNPPANSIPAPFSFCVKLEPGTKVPSLQSLEGTEARSPTPLGPARLPYTASSAPLSPPPVLPESTAVKTRAALVGIAYIGELLLLTAI